MMREISSLIYNASEEQVVRARNQLKASILFSQDGPGGELYCPQQLVHHVVFPPLHFPCSMGFTPARMLCSLSL